MSLPDTIYNQDAFLRSPAAGADGVFDWSWTRGCFGTTRIAPMDIDAVVERHRQFLIFETKNVGVQIPQGQLRTLMELHGTGVVTVLIIHGKQTPERSVGWYPNSTRKIELIGADEARAFVTRWFLWADAQP